MGHFVYGLADTCKVKKKTVGFFQVGKEIDCMDSRQSSDPYRMETHFNICTVVALSPVLNSCIAKYASGNDALLLCCLLYK